MLSAYPGTLNIIAHHHWCRVRGISVTGCASASVTGKSWRFSIGLTDLILRKRERPRSFEYLASACYGNALCHFDVPVAGVGPCLIAGTAPNRRCPLILEPTPVPQIPIPITRRHIFGRRHGCLLQYLHCLLLGYALGTLGPEMYPLSSLVARFQARFFILYATRDSPLCAFE